MDTLKSYGVHYRNRKSCVCVFFLHVALVFLTNVINQNYYESVRVLQEL